MSKNITEKVASYFYDKSVSYGTYDIFAYYNSVENYENRKVDFYDVYDNDGLCLNEGLPFYEFPSWYIVYEAYYLTALKKESLQNKRDLRRAIE